MHECVRYANKWVDGCLASFLNDPSEVATDGLLTAEADNTVHRADIISHRLA